METKAGYQANRSDPPEDRNPPHSKSNVNPPPRNMEIDFMFFPNPLREFPGEGIVRFKGSRVTLDSVLTAFKEGVTPEEIVRRFPTLALADVYTAIAYYLHNKETVEEYLAKQEQKEQETREINEEKFNPLGIKEKLQARRFECDSPKNPD